MSASIGRSPQPQLLHRSELVDQAAVRAFWRLAAYLEAERPLPGLLRRAHRDLSEAVAEIETHGETAPGRRQP
ncbi:MAG: hypothetical protein M3N29_01775 [Chloroflexota bacterium]|nr:hypothetical protein [Chloroflexota bacterium]